MANQPVRRTAEPPPHWDFDEDPHEQPELGPTFTLGGELFHCLPALAGGVMPRLMNAMRLDDRGRQVYNNPDILLFMEDVLAVELPVMRPNPAYSEVQDADAEAVTVPEEIEVWEPCDDVERWQALMFDKTRPQELERIGKIMFKLTEFYTGRPTQPSGR
jgi:hypothetical protein